jgi:hypothetical protein
MRTIRIAAALLLLAPYAIAQTQAERPDSPAPQATASFEARESWCQKYAEWFVERTPPANVAPSDVAPTRRFEVEFNSCKLDPQRYERDTLAELTHEDEASSQSG